MTDDRLSQRATQALQPFRHLGTPVEDDLVTGSRREELVPLIASSLRAVPARRARWRRARRALAAASVAAGLVLLAMQGYRSLSSPDRRAERPTELSAGDRIATSPNAPTSFVLAGGARVEVGPATRVVLVRTDAREQRLKLELGRVELDVPKFAPGTALVVETRDAEVLVRGTRFSVEVSDRAGAGTRVGVSRGSVLVRTARGERLLAGGETWSSVAPASASVPALAPTAAAIPSESEPAVDRSNGALASSDDARDEHRSAAGTSAAARAASAGQRVAEVTAPDRDAPNRTYDTRSPPRSRRVAGASDAPSRGDSDALSQQNGLMQAALAARSRGDHAQAVRLLDELLMRYPNSPLTESARVERFRSLRRSGRHTEATREARRYLASYGRGFARDEARGLVLEPKAPNGSPKR